MSKIKDWCERKKQMKDRNDNPNIFHEQSAKDGMRFILNCSEVMSLIQEIEGLRYSGSIAVEKFKKFREELNHD